MINNDKRQKARSLRYQKAVVKDISMEFMQNELYEMQEECGNVAFSYDDDLAEDLLGEDEASEFKMAFAALNNDIERMVDDLQSYDSWIPECYDDFFSAINRPGEMEMLEPEELKLCQGFPKSYIIDHDIDGNKYPKKEQVARIGNSVVPIMARMLVEENVS